MKIKIDAFDASKIINKTVPKAQKFWINAVVIPRMVKYVPARNMQQPEKALRIGGQASEKGIVEVKGPQMRYLFMGKVMAGKPKTATDKDLNYYQGINKQAGPFWDRRLKQNEIKQMEQEMQAFLHRGNNG